MYFEYCQEKEEALALAGEKVGEAVEALEEVLPDTAEELVWIRDHLARELQLFRTRVSEAAGAGELI